jgi:hypothetical protein
MIINKGYYNLSVKHIHNLYTGTTVIKGQLQHMFAE